MVKISARAAEVVKIVSGFELGFLAELPPAPAMIGRRRRMMSVHCFTCLFTCFIHKNVTTWKVCNFHITVFAYPARLFTYFTRVSMQKPLGTASDSHLSKTKLGNIYLLIVLIKNYSSN